MKLGLFKVILGVIAGYIFVSLITVPGLFDFISDGPTREVIVILVMGLVAGLVAGSPVGGAIAGFITAIVVPTVDVWSSIDDVEAYVNWLQKTEFGEGIKFSIIALVGGFIGGYIIASRSQQTTLRLR